MRRLEAMLIYIKRPHNSPKGLERSATSITCYSRVLKYYNLASEDIRRRNAESVYVERPHDLLLPRAEFWSNLCV